MGCFLGCFGGAKAKRVRRPKVLPRNTNYERQESQLSPCSLIVPSYSLKLPASEIPGISVLDQLSDVIEEKADKTEKLECSKPKIRKKVSFDLQVKTYSEIPSQDELKFSPEKERKRVSECELAETESPKWTPTKDHSSATITGSFPASHRYQNCTNSDGEVDDDVDNDLTDDDYDEDDDDDDDDNDVGAGREVLFEWYSSSSFESETTGVSPPSIKKEADAANLRLTMGVRHARDRSQYVHAVLNPVANVSEWKALKSRDPKNTPLLKERKENIPSNEEGLIKFNSGPRQEMRVDASLSNWLSPTETVGEAYSSITEAENPKKYKDGANRAVFGLLTNEQVSGKPPQRSPYRSPGRNWDKPLVVDDFSSKYSNEIKGIPNTASEYREDH